MAHRDLKVENVLLDEQTGIFKLCDFGSVTTVRMRPSNKHEIGAAEEDILIKCCGLWGTKEEKFY